MTRLRLNDSRREMLEVLCGGRRTAAELAAQLGISKPAVRKTLARLEAEGLVEFDRVRAGAKKPLHEFRITPRGERSLSSAYLPFLLSLLESQEAKLSPAEVGEMMRSVGRRLASLGPSADGERGAVAGLGLLRALGALPSVREEGDRVSLVCGCCAIGAVVADHPEACKAMETMLSEYLGRPVRERCDRSGRPSCRFELG